MLTLNMVLVVCSFQKKFSKKKKEKPQCYGFGYLKRKRNKYIAKVISLMYKKSPSHETVVRSVKIPIWTIKKIIDIDLNVKSTKNKTKRS